MSLSTDAAMTSAPRLRPVSSFFAAPVRDLEALSPSSVAVAGLYCDHFGGGEPGARYAARQLRYTSMTFDLKRTKETTDHDVFDVGDLNVFPLEPQKCTTALAEQCERIIASGARLLCLGGDYSLTPALLKGVLAGMPALRVGVVRISRRLDLAENDASSANAPRRSTATSQLSQLLPGGLTHMALLGAHGIACAEQAYRASAALVISASSLISNPDLVIERLQTTLLSQVDVCYLSVDADVLATRYAPTTLPGLDGGLEPEQLRSLLQRLQDVPLIAADVVGYRPRLDLQGRSATASIAAIALQILEILRQSTRACR